MKNNVYAMLGDLAQDFNGNQMDLLFNKFQACSHLSRQTDVVKVMNLVCQLAISDNKVCFCLALGSCNASLSLPPGGSCLCQVHPAPNCNLCILSISGPLVALSRLGCFIQGNQLCRLLGP